MEPATIRLRTSAGPELIEQLRQRVANDGDPAITMQVETQIVVVLSAATAPIMLTSRVMAAIEDVAGDQDDGFEFVHS